MTYKVCMKARLEREARIDNSVEASSELQEFPDFRSPTTKLPVIEVELDLPIYRMENCRTFTAQKHHIKQEGVEGSHFTKGQEVESVQQVQHELLCKLAHKGKSDSVTPVIDRLRKVGQREPLLMTSAGVVVNGNRRLAAMRELYTEDSVAFKNFRYIKFLVLPKDVTADEIIDIEGTLQAQPETKLDYDWIGDAELVTRLLKRHGTTEKVAEHLNRSKKEIENTLLAFSEANYYLNDWAGTPDEYEKIAEDAVQFFTDIPKRLEGKSQSLKEASRVIAWSLFDNRDQLGDRLYNFNPAFGNLADDVLERMAEQLEISLEPIEGEADSDGIFDFGLDYNNPEPSYEKLISSLKSEETREEAVQALIDSCHAAIEVQKGVKSGEAALKALTQVHSKLAAIDLSRANKSTYRGIDRQLAAISNRVTDLVAEMKKYESK